MGVLMLPELTAGMDGLVGGKAAGLGELLRRGERVPPGFCVSDETDRSDVLAAYALLGGGPVAVRSSATAEDLPDASFAGQQDTLLDVTGADALTAAIARIRDSLHNSRATTYREARGIAHDSVRMTVVVQRMIAAEVAGVLFTANPVTGCRTEMLVDAAPGPGPTVVQGATTVDHYVLPSARSGVDRSPATGCLTSAQLAELQETGARLQEHFGRPQDVEWAYDSDGVLWLLQSRPITTLFPLPPPTGKLEPRVFLEFGHVQGMLRPVTPMGMSTLTTMVTAMLAALGVRVDIVDIGGRLYGDLSDLARDRSARKRLIRLMAVDFGPRAQAAMQQVLADPRFAPVGGRRRTARARRIPRTAGGESRPTPAAVGPAAEPERGTRTGHSLGVAVTAVAGIVRALARPEAARVRLSSAVERLRLESAAPDDLRTIADRLRFLRAEEAGDDSGAIMWPIVAGMLAATLPAQLLKGIAEPGEIHQVLAGMPHNVTIEMNLALWRIAQGATAHRDLLLHTPPADLATAYRDGDLPDLGLAAFLDSYGHRAVAEVDLGVPRWAEDPAPVFAMLANYLRVTDPEQAPDRRFARAAATAEATLADLTARARRQRPIRGRLAGFLLRRARALAGLREAGKFAGLYRLREMRRQLLLIGGELFDDPGDIMFLTLDEVDGAVDHRATIAARRGVHEKELRRKAVPVALLSDGTQIERAEAPEGALRGVGAAAGRATGPARVVHDPATARLEPGEVLVTATTDPGWTPLFLTAAALVTETGAVMAHGPTVAREYGIPAVICVPGATRRIVTGQIVTVDAAAGTVTVHRPEDSDEQQAAAGL